MKITKSHYAHMKDAMSKTLTEETTRVGAVIIRDYRDQVSPKRFRWDLMRAAGLMSFITETLYDYLNDTHIDTALKNIVKELDEGK